jgi:hypothetical protein
MAMTNADDSRNRRWPRREAAPKPASGHRSMPAVHSAMGAACSQSFTSPAIKTEKRLAFALIAPSVEHAAASRRKVANAQRLPAIRHRTPPENLSRPAA